MTERHLQQRPERQQGWFPRWLQDTAMARLGAALLLAIISTTILVSLISMFSGVSVREGRWAPIIFFQFASQFLVAALSDWVAARRDKPLAAIFSAFTLGAAGMVVLVDVVAATLAVPSDVEVTAKQTLYGSIVCVLRDGDCVSAFRATVWFASGIAVLITIVMAALLRSAIASERATSFAQNWVVMVFSSLPLSFSFLFLHQWEGEVLSGGMELVAREPSWLPTERVAKIGASSILFISLFINALAVYSYALLLRIGVKRLSSFAEFISVDGLEVWRAIGVVINLLGNLLLLVVMLTVVILALLLLTVGFALTIEALATLFSAGKIVVSGALSSGVKLTRASQIAVWYPIGILGAFLAALLLVAIRSFQQGASTLVAAAMDALRVVLRFIWGTVSGFIQQFLALSVSAKASLTAVVIGSIALGVYFQHAPQEQGGSPEGEFVCGVCWPPPKSSIEQHFSEMTLSCSARNFLGRSYWAYGSSEFLTHDLDTCTLDADDPPVTMLVVGLASRDDSAEAGFRLSQERAITAANMLQVEFPDAQVIAVAMGRRRAARLSIRSVPDVYLQDREVIVFAAPEWIATPVKREPIDTIAQQLLGRRGLLEQYERCFLMPVSTGVTDLPAIPPTRADEGCSWLVP